MSTTWFTSDLHLGHKNVITYSNRPFTTIEEHDHGLASNWAARVRPEDIVWVLGDIAIEGTWKHGLGILAGLPGRKRLVTGNHDRCWVGKSDAIRYLPAYQQVFEVVTPWARAKIGQTPVLLSHFPYAGDHTEVDRFPQFRLPRGETPLLHGHTHAKERSNRLVIPKQFAVSQVHVGVDAWDYAPVPSHKLEPLLTGRA